MSNQVFKLKIITNCIFESFYVGGNSWQKHIQKIYLILSNNIYQHSQKMDFFDIPDDYKPEKPLTDEEAEQITNYLKGHPLFLKQIPEDISTNPHLVALQAMIDEDPVVEAQNLNKNANTRLKQGPNSLYYMKDAYAKYTTAINLKCKNKELNAKLHCNRASINMKVKNFGKVIDDCKISLSYDPKYIKAFYRLGKSYIAVKRYNECVELLKDQTDPDLKAVANQALTLIQKEKADMAKTVQKEQKAANKIQTYFQQKKWKFAKKSEQLPQGVQIQFVDDKISIPIVVVYPQFSQFDLIAKTEQNQKIGTILQELFNSPLPWDQKGDYSFSSIQIYCEVEEAVLFKLPRQATINELACRVPVRGAIELIILTNNKFAEYYKSQHKIF